MRKKLIGIFVCILLITGVLPTVSPIDIDNNNQPYLESKEYLSSKYLVMINPLIPLDPNCASLKPIPIDTPDEFSWKNYKGKDWTTCVKDQGSVASCWAFATIGALESVIKIREGCSELNPDLSEQYVMSCLPKTCAYEKYPFFWIMDTSADGNYCNGVTTESCFPYQESFDVLCSEKFPDWEDYLIPISDCGYWFPDGTLENREAIKTQIMQKGPVITNILITWSFSNWLDNHHSSNEYYSDRPVVLPLGYHTVVVLGWRNNPSIHNGGYWICKNSWGIDNGYDGFFNLEYSALELEETSPCGNYSAIMWVDYDPKSFDWPNEPDPPNAPMINGPASGEIGIEYEYTFVSTDPNELDVFYYVSWGDGDTEEWIGPYASSEEVTVKHTWNKEGLYTIMAMVLNTHDSISPWGTLSISMPKSKTINTPLLIFLENHPLIYKLLQRLFNL